jgi:hypothetical protein
MTINEFATVCMPFAMTLPEGVTAYTAGEVQTADDVEYIPLTECGTGYIAANSPVVLAAENGTYYIGVGGETETIEGENQLRGVLKSTSVSGSNIYTLNNGEFTKRTSTSGTIAANTAYYTADNAATSLPVKKGEATGIQEVKTEPTVDASQNVKVKGIYDLHGRKVTKPVKGIYIIDGQKVLVK